MSHLELFDLKSLTEYNILLVVEYPDFVGQRNQDTHLNQRWLPISRHSIQSWQDKRKKEKDLYKATEYLVQIII